MSKQSPQQRRFNVALAAASVPPGMVISRMDRLRRAEQHEQADRVALDAVTANPATAAGMLAVLQAAGRRADAEALLKLVASTSAENCGAVVEALSASGAEADARTLIGLLQSRPAADLATAAASYENSAATHHSTVPKQPSDNPLIAPMSARPPEELVAELAVLRGEGRHEQAAALLAVIAQGPPEAVWAAASGLATNGATHDAGSLLVQHARTAPAAALARLYLRLGQFWESAAAHIAPIVAERPDAAAFLVELRILFPEGSTGYPGILTKWLTPPQTAGLCRRLAGRSALAAVEDLLGWWAGRDDARLLQAALHDNGMHAAAYRLAERHAEITGRYET